MCRSNSVWYFFNRPTPTSLLSEHLSRHLPTYETVPSGPRAWTYLPLPPSEGGVSSDRDFARRLARQRRWLVPAWSAQPACQPAAAARRAAQARRRARPRPATTPGSALRPRLRPANSPSAARVRGRRAMADARGEPVRPYLPTLQLHLHAHAVPALSCHTTP